MKTEHTYRTIPSDRTTKAALWMSLVYRQEVSNFAHPNQIAFDVLCLFFSFRFVLLSRTQIWKKKKKEKKRSTMLCKCKTTFNVYILLGHYKLQYCVNTFGKIIIKCRENLLKVALFSMLLLSDSFLSSFFRRRCRHFFQTLEIFRNCICAVIWFQWDCLPACLPAC